MSDTTVIVSLQGPTGFGDAGPLRAATSAPQAVLTTADRFGLVTINVAAPVTVALPANPSVNDCYSLQDVSGHAATNPITIDTTDGSTINGAASQVIAANWGWGAFRYVAAGQWAARF